MIKNTILAENFDGESVAQTCWFNLTRKEVVDFLIEESQQDSVFARSLLSGESTPENLRVVDGITAYQFFVRLVDRSFGERDQDGIHFRKSEKVLRGVPLRPGQRPQEGGQVLQRRYAQEDDRGRP